jgi:hypothetical protein
MSTRHYNKLTEKVIEYVAVATAAATIAFAAWQIWLQYFVTPGGGK